MEAAISNSIWVGGQHGLRDGQTLLVETLEKLKPNRDAVDALDRIGGKKGRPNLDALRGPRQ
ncbi:hypothetical protein D3C83_307960 [compost metagenome]